MFGSLSNLSLIVQILSVIILITTVLTLIIAVFSYIGYKIRQRRKPQQPDEIPDFFWRYSPELFIPPKAVLGIQPQPALVNGPGYAQPYRPGDDRSGS